MDTKTDTAAPPVLRAPLKHFDVGNGFELCSGRDGWSRRMTTDRAKVTCKNCLKTLAKGEQS